MNPCNWCNANLRNDGVGALPWTDTKPNALALETTWTNASWKLAMDRESYFYKYLVEYLEIGFLNVYPDWMYTKYFGTDVFFSRSVIELLVDDIMPEKNR